jgi:hypothetical protein
MMTLMTRDDSVATPATDENVSGIGWELRFLDPDVVDLIAEMDAILCEAVRHHGRPLAPLATGCALLGPQWAGRSHGGRVRPRRAPVRPVRAVQRSPPARS